LTHPTAGSVCRDGLVLRKTQLHGILRMLHDLQRTTIMNRISDSASVHIKAITRGSGLLRVSSASAS